MIATCVQTQSLSGAHCICTIGEWELKMCMQTGTSKRGNRMEEY